MYIMHRGWHNKDIPENSFLAFEKAVKAGYAIEFDVRLTKDNVLVVFHDADTFRMTGVSMIVSESNYADLRKLKLNGTKQYIPKLEKVLDLVAGKVLLDIEIKRGKKNKKLLMELEKCLNDYQGQYMIKSFDPWIVRRYKKNNPLISCGVLSYSFKGTKMCFLGKYFLRNLGYLFFYKPDFVAYNYGDYTKKIDILLKKYKIPVMFWTIRSLDELKKAQKISDFIVLENIDL